MNDHKHCLPTVWMEFINPQNLFCVNLGAHWFLGWTFSWTWLLLNVGARALGSRWGSAASPARPQSGRGCSRKWRLLGPGWASPPPDWWPVISSSARARWGCGWSWLLGCDLHLMGNTSQGLQGIEIDSRFLLISSGMQNRWTHWLMSLTWFMQQYWMQCCMQHCSTAASACSNDSCHLSW